jgi:hypothetical protein
MIWRRNRSSRNKGWGAVVVLKRRFSNEVGVCSRRSCGNHDTGISGRFPRSELRRIRRWIIGWQQQWQRRGLAERGFGRCWLARH